MNKIDQQPVPLGGSRVPDSMGGSISTPWQELPEQQQQQHEVDESFGPACAAMVDLREQVGNLKKQLSNLAAPMKTYIYSSGPRSREEVEAALTEAEVSAASIREAASRTSELAAEDDCLDTKVKAEVLNVLKLVGEEAVQQIVDTRALCLSTLDKKDDVRAVSDDEEKNNSKDKSQIYKDLYGDFNLQLGPYTRKLFASQNKLLALIKIIKKQRIDNSRAC
ncbi:hypothetical protein ACSSS7_002535 [Eimeria intestinalis]